MSPLYIPGQPVFEFGVLGDIGELNKTLKALPGKDPCKTSGFKYSENTVEPM